MNLTGSDTRENGHLLTAASSLLRLYGAMSHKCTYIRALFPNAHGTHELDNYEHHFISCAISSNQELSSGQDAP
jgi:hypothetical protein